MKLEMCIASLEAARLAAKLPIDRVETCVALEQGGLTPGIGMVSWIRDTFNLEQHVLIRQRAGGFQYNYDEILVMRNDILAMRELGVKGVVIGALTATNELNIDALEAWHRAAGTMELTCHRAFDEVKDWKKAMDQLIRMGFTRILTSGQAVNVDSGKETLSEMVAYAAGRIEIMAGGGVRPENIAAIKETGVSAVHFSGTISTTVDPDSFFATTMNQVDEALVKQLVKK